MTTIKKPTTGTKRTRMNTKKHAMLLFIDLRNLPSSRFAPSQKHNAFRPLRRNEINDFLREPIPAFVTVGEGLVSTFVAGRESPDFDQTPEDWTGQPEPVAVWQGTAFAAPKVAAAVATLLLDGRSGAEAVAELQSRGRALKGYGVALTDDILP